jgi:beta-phosphoglucomutase
MLNTPPKACVVFEDAQAGVEAALNGGMYCIGVGNPEILHKAHRVIPSLAALSLSDLDLLDTRK